MNHFVIDSLDFTELSACESDYIERDCGYDSLVQKRRADFELNAGGVHGFKHLKIEGGNHRKKS